MLLQRCSIHTLHSKFQLFAAPIWSSTTRKGAWFGGIMTSTKQVESSTLKYLGCKLPQWLLWQWEAWVGTRRPRRSKSSPCMVGGRCASLDATCPPKLLRDHGPDSSSFWHQYPAPWRLLPSWHKPATKWIPQFSNIIEVKPKKEKTKTKLSHLNLLSIESK
jgi:hypothetical protein